MLKNHSDNYRLSMSMLSSLCRLIYGV